MNLVAVTDAALAAARQQGNQSNVIMPDAPKSLNASQNISVYVSAVLDIPELLTPYNRKHKRKHDKPYRCEEPDCKRALEGFTTSNDLDRHNWRRCYLYLYRYKVPSRSRDGYKKQNRRQSILFCPSLIIVVKVSAHGVSWRAADLQGTMKQFG